MSPHAKDRMFIESSSEKAETEAELLVKMASVHRGQKRVEDLVKKK